MKEGESVDAYFARTLTVTNKMRIHGERMADIIVSEKIMRSMSSKFDYVVCPIEESKNVEDMSIDELQSSLVLHEQRMRSHVVEEQALAIAHDTNTGERGRGHRGRGRGRGKVSFDKSVVECYYCHDLGHYQYECPKKKAKELKSNFAETSDDAYAREEVLLMAYVADEGGASDKEAWFLDSGCSNHMCGKQELFSSLDEGFRKSIKLGNNSKLDVMGKGTIRMHVGAIVQVISEVFYVPALKNNLLSIGQLQEKGLAILIRNNMCKVFHPQKGLIIETTMSLHRMFVLFATIQSQDHHCLHTHTEPDYLWHCRYGHLSFGGLKLLHQRQMVKGLPPLTDSSLLCEYCMMGKQHRRPFPRKSVWRATQVLQLLHADICSPISPISNSQKRYLLTFIDDFSRKLWVFFLTEKSEAFSIFKVFKAQVETDKETSIKGLRTDQGGEFTSQNFNDFCAAHGIHRQLTASYTPQQNGVAERKNRTIMNMVRCMLISKQVPKTFWPEAVNWAVHILNQSPTLVVRNKTPEEVWSGSTPSVAHFRVFGCLSYAHIPDSKCTKLEVKSLKCVRLGVSDES